MDDDEDYWNTSETKFKALNFDDDVLSPQEILEIGQKSTQKPGTSDGDLFSITNTLKSPLLPLSSLVSPKVLDLILLAQSGKDLKDHCPPEPEETVPVTLKRLVLGRPRSLHCHRSLKSKTELLDGAIAIGDGNAVLAIVLFLIQTLNKKLVYELLSSRPVALNHYISFLQNEGRITELTDLLTMLGKSPDAAMYQLAHHVRSQASVDGLLRKLGHVQTNHFMQPGIDAHQAKCVAGYIKFLEWQKCTNNEDLKNKSVVTCLAYCCTHHWNEGAGKMMSPLTLCQQQQISPQQYDWVVLNVHANLKNWDVVESLFTRKDWLGRSTLSSHVPPRLVACQLSSLGGSPRLLAAFINKLPREEERLQLALQFKVHAVVIETFAKQKDRAALTNYKMTISPQTEEFILAETTLRDPSIKWKN